MCVDIPTALVINQSPALYRILFKLQEKKNLEKKQRSINFIKTSQQVENFKSLIISRLEHYVPKHHLDWNSFTFRASHEYKVQKYQRMKKTAV